MAYYMTDWSDDFLIGIDKIDNQHKEFFRLAHQFYTECMTGEGEEAIWETLKAINKYAKNHFKAEEAFMKEIGYDRLDEHAGRHTDFIAKYSNLMGEFKEQGPTDKIVNNILSFVMDWLKDHIVEVDVAYVRHAKEREQRD